ncbi:MAG TPA: hypothetical protein VGJ54_10115, partial [Streptosporangiaceae bacterium]
EALPGEALPGEALPGKALTGKALTGGRMPADPLTRVPLNGEALAGGRRPAVQAAQCSRHGQHWRIDWGPRTAVIRNSVGLLHLAVLLANPDQEIPAIDLVAGVAALSGTTAATSGMSAQPLLDPVAARQYRHRLTQLKAELAEQGDRPGRVTRAEHDWLVAELARATGIGGRTRHFTDSAERARLAAGRAIRRALAHIEKADPLIGQHLRTSIHTGVRCSYRPA